MELVLPLEVEEGLELGVHSPVSTLSSEEEEVSGAEAEDLPTEETASSSSRTNSIVICRTV